jgi:hypothetical protein
MSYLILLIIKKPVQQTQVFEDNLLSRDIQPNMVFKLLLTYRHSIQATRCVVLFIIQARRLSNGVLQ